MLERGESLKRLLNAKKLSFYVKEKKRDMNTPENIAYTAKAEITGGRDGRGATDD